MDKKLLLWISMLMVLCSFAFAENSVFNYSINCANPAYTWCDDFTTNKGYNGTYTISDSKMKVDGSVTVTFNATNTQWNASQPFCIEFFGNMSNPSGKTIKIVFGAGGGTNDEHVTMAGGGGASWFIANTGAAIRASGMSPVANANLSLLYCMNASKNPYLNYTAWYNTSRESSLSAGGERHSSTFNYAPLPWDNKKIIISFILNDAAAALHLDYFLIWNGTWKNAPYYSPYLSDVLFSYPKAGETYNNFNGYVNITTNLPANCSINNSWFTLYYTNYTNTSFYNSTPTTLPSGNYSILVNCSTADGSRSNSTIKFALDTTVPTIWTNITTGTFIKVGTSYGMQINLSDNILLWGHNFSINGFRINWTYNLQVNNYNFTKTNNSWVVGKNNISIEVYDAHTALETDIKTEEISKIGNSLKVRETTATSLTSVDKITYIKEMDKYTFCYYYKDLTTTSQIQMSNNCYYQNKENLYTGWFVCGTEWWDFENDNYITTIKDNKVTSTTKDGKPIDKFCYNSVGSLNYNSANYSLWGWNDSVSYTTPVIEESSNTFTLTILGNTSFTGLASLVYNNTVYATTETVNANNKTYNVSVLSPIVSIDTLVPFYFNYSINGVKYNSSFFNQTVKNFFVTTSCTGNLTLLNLSLRDEETKAYTFSNESTIELDLKILKDGVDYLTYYTSVNSNNLTVCMTNASFVWSDYSVEFIASYVSTGYVKEFYYLDNGDFNNNCSFNSYTSCHIDLYDLLSADSTTFLFKFFDESGLSVDDSIIHTYRKYIGDGLFREVERSKEDNNGETHIHLVEEDVIYYFMVTQYGDIVYTSDNYNAKCLSSPCSIELSATADFTEFPTNWNVISNVSYNIVSDKATRMVTTSFVSDEHIMFNVSVYKYNNNVATLINGSTFNGTSGSVVLHIPTSYGNSTYFVVLYKNSTFLNSDWVNFNPTAKDLFGSNGLILGALLVMAVGLMCVSEGVILIIGVCLALLLIGVMFLIDISWLAIISIICAGSIIVWKMVKK